MPRPKNAAPAAVVAVPAAKARAGLSIASRHDEPCAREVWDVAYQVNGEDVADKGFLSEEAAEAHAVGIRKAYGL